MTSAMPEFVAFPKTPRFFRDIIITEKLDGTNAQVYVTEDGQVFAGSRNRWLTPQNDNFGFAAWVAEHQDELLELGPGRHFGEWWGKGIQRGYDLECRRFSLFNTKRFSHPLSRPPCCDVVPVLYEGLMSSWDIYDATLTLRTLGSIAAPGFMKPEGIIIFHTASNQGFKVLLENDDISKSSIHPITA